MSIYSNFSQIVPDSVNRLDVEKRAVHFGIWRAELQTPSGGVIHAGSLIQLESGSSPQHKWPATKI